LKIIKTNCHILIICIFIQVVTSIFAFANSGVGSEPIATIKNPVSLNHPAVPYPSDLFASADDNSKTGIKINISNALLNSNMLLVPSEWHPDTLFAGADGFSAGTPILFEVGGAIDPDTLPLDGGDSFLLIDSETYEAVPVFSNMSKYALDRKRSTTDYLVQATPRKRLEYGATYIACLTKNLKKADGGDFTCSNGMMQAISNDGSDVSNFYEPYIQIIEDNDISREEILSATVFTVRSRDSILGPIIKAAQSAYDREHPAKILYKKKIYNPSSKFSYKIYGEILVTDFRDRRNEVDFTFSSGYSGNDEWVRFILYIPRTSKKFPAPVSIFGHGVAGKKEDAYNIAKANAELGVATIAIDQAGHGSRILREGWNTLAGILFGYRNFYDGSRIISSFYSAGYDQISVLKALETSFRRLDVNRDGRPDLDTSQIVYQGTSMGGSVGMMFAGVAPNLKGAYVSVAGSNISTFFGNSDFFNIHFSNKMPSNVPGADYAVFWAMAQQMLDHVDNLNVLDTFKDGLSYEETDFSIEPRPLSLMYTEEDSIVPYLASLTTASFVGMPQIPFVKVEYDYFDMANGFDDGFGLLQLTLQKFDINPKDLYNPITGPNINGFMGHLFCGITPTALQSQKEWLSGVLDLD